MKTCKDCLHYKSCKMTYLATGGHGDDTFEEYNLVTICGCDNFADKSEWVHLPNKDCATAYYPTGYGGTAKVIEEPIKGFGVLVGKLCVIDVCGDLYEVGTEVFLSKEDAEKALAERRGK